MYNGSMPSNGKVIGLTGNMASGKSSVAKFLAELGIPVVDADQVSREVTALGSPLLKKITAAFGPKTLDTQGHLNRQALRELAFKDELSKQKLEGILHPAIRKRSLEHFQNYFSQGKPVVIYEATLIIESGRSQDFDGILLITCDDQKRLERARLRDPALSLETAQRMLAAQMPQSEKENHATWTLQNNGTLEELRKKVRDWANEFVIS